MTLATERPATAETFESLEPRTGNVVGTFPVHTAAEVEAAVARAREAFGWWQQLGWSGRKDRLDAWKRLIVRRGDELAELVHRENGKPISDARLTEVTLPVDHIAWAAKNAPKVLGERKVSSGLLMGNQAASLQYQALGVVGVIGPWNYPVLTPMG
jgi:aldehyde dehydrogenase (NAD+)